MPITLEIGTRSLISSRKDGGNRMLVFVLKWTVLKAGLFDDLMFSFRCASYCNK